MNSRVFLYPIIVTALFIHPIVAIIVVLGAVIFAPHFYESIAVVLAIDIWFSGGISYGTITLGICLLGFYFARPYMRI